jgi:hypothetical protein
LLAVDRDDDEKVNNNSDQTQIIGIEACLGAKNFSRLAQAQPSHPGLISISECGTTHVYLAWNSQ